jgi:hypothetical protein
MSNTPKRDFTAKTARPVLDATSLYRMEEISPLPATPTETVATPSTPVALDEAAAQEWVQFSTYLKRNTYLRLKQAEYWEPGFVAR